MLKTLFISIILIFLTQGCSSKKVEKIDKIDYKTQQKNSKEALKEL